MKIKRILLMILGASLAVAICLGAWMLGFATRSQNAAYRWLIVGISTLCIRYAKDMLPASMKPVERELEASWKGHVLTIGYQ